MINIMPFNCSVCKYSARDNYDLSKHCASKKHIKNIEMQSKCCKCRICLKVFKNAFSLGRHMKTIHADLQEKSEPPPKKPYLEISELEKDILTTYKHKMVLRQMSLENCDIQDYMPVVDELISEDSSRFYLSQEDPMTGGQGSKTYSISIVKYFEIFLEVICKSTSDLVITHRDITVDGSKKLMLFKHNNVLYPDIIIRKIATKSKHFKSIKDNGEQFPKTSDHYNKLFETLESKAMERKVKKPKPATPLCNSCGLFQVDKSNGHKCSQCFAFENPNNVIAKKHKTKEWTFTKKLQDELAKQDIACTLDKRIDNACSLRRPDAFIDVLTHVLIVEIDEFQHVGYSELCNNRRTMELSRDVNHRPIVFIRLNPDSYTLDGIKHFGCFDSKMRTNMKEFNRRYNELSRAVMENMAIVPERCIECIELFFSDSDSD